MTGLRVWLARGRALFGKRRLDSGLDEELEFHLQMAMEEKLRRGMTAEQARREARLEFGGLEGIKESYRDARGFPWLESLLQDVRYAFRLMKRQRALTAVVVTALALGVGANTSIFSVLNTLFLRPLPYPDAERLVLAGEVLRKEDRPGALQPARVANFRAWRERSRAFDGLAAIRREELNVNRGTEPERVEGDRVSVDFFAVFGMKPALGRVFTAEDYAAASGRVMVISDRYWRTAFDARPEVVGETIRVEGSPTTIVGVMPPRFRSALLEGSARFWIPLAADLKDERVLSIVARLKSGIAFEQARAELNAIAGNLEGEEPASNRGWGVHLEPMQAFYAQAGTSMLARLLVLASALLLVIACANVANLLLARGAERRKEIALRIATGASRLRVLRQLMIENLMYALAGGAGGLLLAFSLTPALSRFAAIISGGRSFEIDGRVLLFTLLAAGATALLFGAVPAIRCSRVDLFEALKEGGAGQPGAVSKRRFSSALVVAQITLSLILLITAGFVLKSIYRLWQFDWGFPTANRLSMDLALSPARYPDASRRLQFYEDLLARVQSMPGVRSAALAGSPPMEFVATTATVSIPKVASPLAVAQRSVSQDYLNALGIGLRQGRALSREDRAAVLVNESLARRAWGEGDPLGQELAINAVGYTVVGVTADTVNQGLLKKPGYEVTLPYGVSAPESMSLIVFAEGDPRALALPVKKAVASLDPDQAVSHVRTLDAVHTELCRPLEFVLLLLTLFATVAMVLSAVGVYALTAHSVVSRTREIGIRMAMGAGARRLMGEILRRGFRLALVGILLGAAGAFVTVRLLLSKIWWLGPTGPLVVAEVAAVLGLVALLACYVPARRATKIDPASALRAE